ncbi:MAG: biotin-dependent carboxyltransferase family protein [Acidobacteriota bacterium]
MSLIFKKPGILTTVQDLGRTGSQSAGINPNGVMDAAAARLINAILGNDDSAAVLEMHFPAAEIEFDEGTVFALGGADLGAELDGRELRNWCSSFAKKGSVLKFAARRSGNRAYLGALGGFEIDKWLGSSSTNLAVGGGSFSGRRLIAGDRLDVSGSSEKIRELKIGPSIIPRYSRFPTVRIIAGCEFEFLTANSERMFLSEGFTFTRDCDRMGYRLSGTPLHLLHERQMVSSAVTFGTVQLLPDGQIIILMADHQTSGGYPRIANVVSADLPILAQCGPGDGVSFAMISVAEAELLAVEFENELNFLRVGCRLRNHDSDD